MRLFEEKKQKPIYTIIAGCTGFAAALAGRLSAQGIRVLILAGNQEDFLSISLSLDGNIIAGDVTDPNVLEEANMGKADTVVTATADDNTNLLVAQLAREAFGVRQVVAIINDSERESVYRELGIATVNPTLISAKEIAGQLCGEKKEDAL